MTHNASQYWITHTQQTIHLCHTEGVSHLSNDLTALACPLSLCGEGVEGDNTSSSVLALSTASLPVATSLSTPLDDDDSVGMVPFRGVEVLSKLPACTVDSCCCQSAGGASNWQDRSWWLGLHIRSPTCKNTGSMQLRLLVSRAPGSYIEVTGALDGSVDSRVTCSGTGCCQERPGPVEHSLLPPAAHHQPTTVCGFDCSHRTLHNTVSDVK